MNLPRRKVLRLAANAVALPAIARLARADTYPSRPVRMVVGFAPSGSADIIARLIAQWLTDRLGQPFVVENRPGAAMNIATEMVAKANPDGYTLLNITTINAWNASVYPNLNFNFIRDIAPIASATRTGGVLEVHPSVPVKTIPDFIAYAKANPGKINMGTGGPGSGPHMYGALFEMMTGIELVPVHYHGTGPALPDLLSGRLQCIFDLVISSIEYIRAGRLRPLGVTTATRYDVLPDVPAIAEFVPGYEASGWQGLGAPANTPVEILDKLHDEVNAALADPAFKARFVELGAPPFPTSREAFGKLIAADTEKWAKVVKFANIKAE
ncbi:MAG TPA: tripartite tricarboxylate transporter substrate binding protein [Xanthobacteraceae bacterium]|nr:tripartite tricarboxylate transporter substrate binding protein [Xanthobacteraceae bacterium]